MPEKKMHQEADALSPPEPKRFRAYHPLSSAVVPAIVREVYILATKPVTFSRQKAKGEDFMDSTTSILKIALTKFCRAYEVPFQKFVDSFEQMEPG